MLMGPVRMRTLVFNTIGNAGYVKDFQVIQGAVA
jgi:hypothetical protein